MITAQEDEKYYSIEASAVDREQTRGAKGGCVSTREASI